MLFFGSSLALVPFLSASSDAATVRASYPGHGTVNVQDVGTRKECTVLANGDNISDVSNILKAFSTCGNGGDIVFPEDQNYFIGSKLNPVVNDVNIEWRGIWTVRLSQRLRPSEGD